MVATAELQAWAPTQEMVNVIRRAFLAFPEVAAAFIWMWEATPHNVLVVLNCRDKDCCSFICGDNDLRARFAARTEALQGRFPELTFSDEHWSKWRKQDGFGGYQRIYLRP